MFFGLIGLIIGAFSIWRFLRAEHSRLIAENLTLRRNILKAKSYEDWRLARLALGVYPVPTLEQMYKSQEDSEL